MHLNLYLSVEEEDLLGDLPPRGGGALSPETSEWDRDREMQHREPAVRVLNKDVTLYKVRIRKVQFSR